MTCDNILALGRERVFKVHKVEFTYMYAYIL